VARQRRQHHVLLWAAVAPWALGLLSLRTNILDLGWETISSNQD
jgi:hypothetical protein